MTMPDPLVAILTFLKADAGVAAIAATRVFGEEIPQDQVTTVATGETILQTVVVRRSGAEPSVGDASRVKFSRPRFDVFSYGETPHRAAALDLACYEALKQMEPTVQGTCRLHDAVLLSGPIAMREPDTQWPLVWRSYAVAVAETAA